MPPCYIIKAYVILDRLEMAKTCVIESVILKGLTKISLVRLEVQTSRL